MDKLKYIKLENEDGSYSDSIPLSVDSDYVDVNGTNLTDVLTSKANTNQIDDLQNEIDSLASGSPKGVYATTTELISANPATGVYIITADGHIYSWTKNASAAVDLGVYQATGINDKSIIPEKLKYATIDNYYNVNAIEYNKLGGNYQRLILPAKPGSKWGAFCRWGNEIIRSYSSSTSDYNTTTLLYFFNSTMTDPDNTTGRIATNINPHEDVVAPDGTEWLVFYIVNATTKPFRPDDLMLCEMTNKSISDLTYTPYGYYFSQDYKLDLSPSFKNSLNNFDTNNNSITVNKINSTFKNNIFRQYEIADDIFENPTGSGYVKNNHGIATVITASDHSYKKIELESYTDYFFVGWTTNIVTPLIITDENNNVTQEITLTEQNAAAYKSIYFTTNQNDRYAYISYPSAENSYNLMHRAASKLIKINRISFINNTTIQKIDTIEDYLIADNLNTVGSPISLNPVADPQTHKLRTDIYKINKGITYKITGSNYAGMISILITDNNNIITYKCNTSESTSVYEFTPNYDGMAFLSYWETHTTAPVIKIMDNCEVLKEIIEDLHLEDYSDIKWGLMGDSITDTTWRAGKNYWGYIQDDIHIQINNVAHSGTGYTKGGDNSVPNQVGQLDSDCDIVTIMAGVNDIAWTENPVIGQYNDNVETDSLMGKINGTLDALETKFGGRVRIGFIAPLPSCIQPDIFSEQYQNRTLYPKYENNNMTKYVEELIKLCNYRGYPILNLYNNSGLMPQISNCRELYFKAGNYPADGLHPNADGHKFIYKAVLTFIKSLI